jgi:hypothetical protein
MSKPKAPRPPDPNVVAGAQTQQNRDTAGYNAQLNRLNTYSPLGSQTYTQTGIDPTTGAPITRQDINLDPAIEQNFRSGLALDQRTTDAAGGRLGQIEGMQPFSLSGLPQRSDINQVRGNAQDALYKRNTAFLDPQFQQNEDRLRTRLANQGVTEGSEAYTNAMGDFSRNKEFSYGQARDSAIAGGGAEADRAFSMDEQQRNNMISEMLMGRSVPMQELQQLRGMSQPQMPQFQGTPQVGTNPANITDAMGQQYQGQMDVYNQRNNTNNAWLATLGTLGGAALMMSDERVKDDISQVGELNDGTNVYLFRYKGDDTPQIGVMAQEVEKKDTKAVKEIGGIKHVDYAKVLSRALEAA